MKRIACFLFVAATLWGCKTENESRQSWSLMLNLPDKSVVEVVKLPEDLSEPFSVEKSVNDFDVKFALTPKKGYTAFKATVTSVKSDAKCFLSLRSTYSNGKPWNFNGEVTKSDTYRQSPHDVNAWIVTDIAEQAVPMVVLKKDSSFLVAVSNSPAYFNNFTSQQFNLEAKTVDLCSGDNGGGTQPDSSKLKNLNYNTEKTQIFTPGKVLAYYQNATNGKPHVFEGIIFTCQAQNLNGLRQSVNKNVADYFSNGKYTDYFGSLAFTTAYMNLRVNETGKSNFWVIPSVEYANTQYCRDAFWISTMLSPEMEAQCLKSELDSVNHYAEYPLFTVIWAYRNKMKGMDVDMAKVQKYVDAIEKHVKDGYFHSYDENDGRLDFQFWGDMVAFEKSDIITYNQGLFALQQICAEKMGLKTKTTSELAIRNYKGMFLPQQGFFPLSKLKTNILGPDPLVPDFLAQMLLGKPLLDKSQVQQHFEKIKNNSKTPFGYKIYCAPDGSYLPYSAFDIANYISQVHKDSLPDGRYHQGGSWTLYDMLFLMDAYMHGVDGAKQELVWRACIDFKIGGTTYECINTKTGEPWKPNMGWNVAIYAFMRQLIDAGKMDKEVLEAIDKTICN
jgi:hypothetical protein